MTSYQFWFYVFFFCTFIVDICNLFRCLKSRRGKKIIMNSLAWEHLPKGKQRVAVERLWPDVFSAENGSDLVLIHVLARCRQYVSAIRAGRCWWNNCVRIVKVLAGCWLLVTHTTSPFCHAWLILIMLIAPECLFLHCMASAAANNHYI